MNIQFPILLRVWGFCELFGLSRATTYKLISLGKLRAEKKHRERYIVLNEEDIVWLFQHFRTLRREIPHSLLELFQYICEKRPELVPMSLRLSSLSRR